MYTLVLEYKIRKFITTKILANNEYAEDQLEKGDGYLHKLLQVVPAFVEGGQILGSRFSEDGSQIVVQAELAVPAITKEAALRYFESFRKEIPDQESLCVIEVKEDTPPSNGDL
ncbi:hypothetical protein CIG75_12155 [Tumebacillus algifaecis]|uniref:Uncharacterized protein n=1 Tax=Tumebacillus algifaecis TaxID=1214604 RepID=A0A223D1Z4_9BACL|nr:hypothetical protein [Tumebacillus algifaecis]ASS75668.1 hypothetical protein CIG75_12155 [Tumebacillus algifaecis]